MDVTRLRILDTLARTLGETHSIRGLVDEIEALHGTAHYANVHEELQAMAADGVLTLQEAGRSKVPQLSLTDPGFPDTMAQLELWRKQALRQARPVHESAIHQLEEVLTGDPAVATVSLVDGLRNLDLRRIEPLVLTREPHQQGSREAEIRLTGLLRELANDTALRIDPLVMPQRTFLDRIQERVASPLPRMLRRQTCLLDPQRFWRGIQQAIHSWGSLAPATPRRPGELPQDAIAGELSRYGYVERGREIDTTRQPSCPEIVVVAALAAEEARWLGAAAVVLSKTEADPGLLAYLAMAEGRQETLLGVLETLAATSEEAPWLNDTIRLLDAAGAEATSIDGDLIQEALELYG